MKLYIFGIAACVGSFLNVALKAQAQAQAEVSVSDSNAGDFAPAPVTTSEVLAVAKKIKFKVMQKGTGQLLRKVEITAGSQKVFTDPEGNAEVDFSSEVKSFTIVRNGFDTVTLNAEEYRDTLELDVYMYPRLGADDEVIVKGKRRPSVSKKVISVVEAAKVAPGGDPGQVTRLMPGVTSSPGRSEITIRGSAPQDSLYQIDDIRVPFLYHTVGQLTVIPPDAIEDVEFSSGGFGAEYGDATGGVVVIRTKKSIPERAVTRFTLNLPIYSGITHERPLSEDSGMSVGIRRSYLDLILPRVIPKDSGITLVPFFSDYQGSWVHKTDSGSQKLTLLASSDGIKATVPSDFSDNESGAADFFVKTYFGVIAFEHTQSLNPEWTAVTTPQLVYTDNQFKVNDLNFRVRAYDARLPLEFSKRISSTEKLYTGLDLSYVPYTVTFYLPVFDQNDPFADFEEAPKEKFDQKSSFYSLSSWIARDFQLGNWLLTPGLRAFNMSQNHQTSADPRFASRYSLTKEQTLKMAVGQYSQFPKNGEAASGFGNPDLKFTNAMHYILGIESKWDERWETDVQVFYKDVKDVIRNDAETRYSNKGALRSRGAELFVRRALSERWFGWLAYTWSKTEERASPDKPWYPGEQDQTHVLSLAGNYRWSPTWETGGRFASHTGDTYTSKIGPAVYNANLDKYQPRGDVDAVNNARLPHYNEVALYNAHDFLYDTSKLTFRWGVEYLWLKSQVLSQSANYDYSAEEESQGLPPIPYIELRGEL